MATGLKRALLVLIAVTAAVAALAGLARLGLAVPGGAYGLSAHGPLFVLGVFGTVIALERAVAFGALWGYAAPLASACAAALMLIGAPGAPLAATAAAVALLSVNARIVVRQPAPFTWLMLLGSAVLALGDAAWAMGRAIFEVVPAWVGFFALTIGAERLELSRLAPTPRWASRTLVALSVALAGTIGASLAHIAIAPRAVGVILSLVALWQLRFDLARRTIRLEGLPRFSATGVLLGAAWLLAAGVILTLAGLPAAGPTYDAFVHAVMVGFVLSMVFAHAPIILPAVARIEIPFHPVLYVPLAVLELGLAARVAGDLLGAPTLRQIGGASNAATLVLFLAAVLWTRHTRRKLTA